MAKKGKGGFSGILAAGGALRDVGKRGVQTSYLVKAGMRDVMKRAGNEARTLAAAAAPAGQRSKPRYDRAPKGRKYPYMKPGLLQKVGSYSYYVNKRPLKVRVVAGSGFKGAGGQYPSKAYAARVSPYAGHGIQYAGGGSPGRIIKAFGNDVLVGKRKGKKRRVKANNWIKPAIEDVSKKYGPDMARAYNLAVKMRIQRAVARGRPY